MIKYKAILFDLDGTLLYTLEDLMIAVNTILKKHNEPERTIHQIREAVGNGNRRLMALSLRGGEEHPHLEELFLEYLDYYKNHCTVTTKIYPGIEETLSYCKENNIKIGVVTNKASYVTESLVKHYFNDAFPFILGDDGINPKKPSSIPAEKAFSALNISKSETLYIGDSPIDYEFSKNAGMDCMLVSYGFNEKETLQKLPAKYHVDSAFDIIPTISEQENRD